MNEFQKFSSMLPPRHNNNSYNNNNFKQLIDKSDTIKYNDSSIRNQVTDFSQMYAVSHQENAAMLNDKYSKILRDGSMTELHGN